MKSPAAEWSWRSDCAGVAAGTLLHSPLPFAVRVATRQAGRLRTSALGGEDIGATSALVLPRRVAPAPCREFGSEHAGRLCRACAPVRLGSFGSSSGDSPMGEFAVGLFPPFCSRLSCAAPLPTARPRPLAIARAAAAVGVCWHGLQGNGGMPVVNFVSGISSAGFPQSRTWGDLPGIAKKTLCLLSCAGISRLLPCRAIRVFAAPVMSGYPFRFRAVA